ncbi:MAG: protein kinase [Gammaproteobacteria bacterium]|nr:protein kinase [Gammaproteobacteria bacterium]
MELAEFTTLIKGFLRKQLSTSELSAQILNLLARDSKLKLSDLLSQTQIQLQNGMLDPKNFRLISELLNELAIQRAISDQESNQTNDSTSDETLIMRSPPGSGSSDETLIMPRPPSNFEKTVVQTVVSHSDSKSDRSKNKPSNTRVSTGDILKKRFELLELIGHGGMGVVYRARDLVKVKARDNNPYLAIKVLSEAFSKHSRAFIALQREASKAQRLAHPNIATVYDFDHDGSTIFMTMELLHGQPFDSLIGQLPPGGLPLATAMRYIEELCSGLAYAHKQNLIHCDLKPANIFLCDNGAVKLLDFGITRAVKKEQQEVGDETLFDPASLKALTPAYASVEMFRGDPPDTRDDIYALACVAYELLTGMHPYKKVAAHKALELDLKPQNVKGLSRRQQKALNNALALERDKRTPTIQQFLEGIRKPKSHALQLAIAGVVVLIISAVLLINPIRKQWHEENQLQLIQSIKNGNQDQLVEMISAIRQQNDSQRAYLTSILRKEIITYYQERINHAINAKSKRYDFPKAAELLEQVKVLYPDSASLAEAEKELRRKKERLVSMLLNNYKELSQRGKDTTRVIEILREADPQNPLLQQISSP